MNEKNISLDELIKKTFEQDPFWETLVKRFFDNLPNKSDEEKINFLNKIIKDNSVNEFLKEVNSGNDVNTLFDKYSNGKKDTSKITLEVSRLLDISLQELNANSKRIDESNATYYYNQERGGKHVIVADDGSYLAAGSATNYEKLLEEFNNGRRNGNF